MSGRIVVMVQQTAMGELQILLHQSPRRFDGARVARNLGIDEHSLPNLVPPDGVRQYGQQVYRALKSHAAIESALVDASSRAEQTPIYFWCTAAGAERIVWETLCDDTGSFLALRRNWPIGRMADSEVSVGGDEIVWSPPLRVFAVLSAIPFSAQAEWDGLYQAVLAAREDGLPIELRVMVGEESLVQAIRDLDDPFTRADPVPPAAIDIETAIENFKPQIMHFFCHGSAAFGRASLDLASGNDWIQYKGPPVGEPNASVSLNLDQLTDWKPISNVWLVMLNCCKGGQAGEDVHSLAHSLVCGGVGAAVGMLEPVDAADAHEFCRQFYPSIFRQVRERFAATDAGAAFELEWSDSLYPPRSALGTGGAADAAADRRWCLPVLYATPERFLIRRSLGEDRDAALRAGVHRDVYEGFLAVLGDESPDTVRIDARDLRAEADTILFGPAPQLIDALDGDAILLDPPGLTSGESRSESGDA